MYIYMNISFKYHPLNHTSNFLKPATNVSFSAIPLMSLWYLRAVRVEMDKN